jgi:hypothetical protein
VPDVVGGLALKCEATIRRRLRKSMLVTVVSRLERFIGNLLKGRHLRDLLRFIPWVKGKIMLSSLSRLPLKSHFVTRKL